MSEIFQNIVVILVLAVVVGALFLFIRQRQARNQQELRQLAAENGWEYQTLREPLAWGTRFTAPSWTIEALSRSQGPEAGPGSSNIAMTTTWRADLPGNTLLIGPRSYTADLGPMGDMLLRQVMELTLGPESAGVREVTAGSDTFRHAYAIWARDAVAAHGLLDPGLEAALLTWPGEKPVIKHTSDGISIELRGVRLKKRDEILALAGLGQTLLIRLKT
jgi:hypothetical protein